MGGNCYTNMIKINSIASKCLQKLVEEIYCKTEKFQDHMDLHRHIYGDVLKKEMRSVAIEWLCSERLRKKSRRLQQKRIQKETINL